MKKAMGWAVLAACLAAPAMTTPAMAQDETAPAADAGAAPAEDASASAPAADDAAAASSSGDSSAAEAVTGGGDATAVTDSSSSGDSSSSSDVSSSSDTSTIATDDSSSSDSSGGGHTFYIGLDYDMTKIDINDKGTREALGRRRFESNFYKLRLGARIFEGVGLEFHAGFPDNNASSKKLETKQFYGLYLVPTGVLFDVVEISARLGYAYTELKSELGKDDADGASFGLAVELPLRNFGEGMPNLRVGVGGTVYQEERDGRVFGWHGGVRYDFTL
jgi:hypothetical protein